MSPAPIMTPEKWDDGQLTPTIPSSTAQTSSRPSGKKWRQVRCRRCRRHPRWASRLNGRPEERLSDRTGTAIKCRRQRRYWGSNISDGLHDDEVDATDRDGTVRIRSRAIPTRRVVSKLKTGLSTECWLPIELLTSSRSPD